MTRNLLKTAAMAAFLLAMGSAQGQYVWLDEKGVKQFSDTPPPASVPDRQILKSPGKKPAATPLESEPASAPQAASAPVQAASTPRVKSKEPMTTAEHNAEFQKRKLEQAEKEKKSAEEDAKAKAKAANCERARGYKRTLDSGRPIGRTDKNGERAIISDQERAKEEKEVNQILSDCNK